MMKKGILLNAEVSALVARLGHTDEVVIADAGLPIPSTPQRIDLALTRGIPGFLQVAEALTSEMQVEKAIMAEEVVEHNPALHQSLLTLLSRLQQRQGNIITLEYISHQAFKARSAGSRAIVRSGECSPYANVILCSGVTF